jgi:PEP-CTERM motif
MTMNIIRRLLIGAVLVALSVACASAAACPTTATSLATYLPSDFTCTIGDKLFSNFTVLFSGYHGDVASQPLVPANSDVTVVPVQSVLGITADEGFVFTFNANNFVGVGQGLTLDIQYLVTVTDPNYTINNVYTEATGGKAATGNGFVTADKNLCLGAGFDITASNGFATNTCTAGTSVSGTLITLGTMPSDLWNTKSIANQTILGVSDYIVVDGGNIAGAKNAQINQLANVFEQVQRQTGVPEPATFLLLGSALLGLGALRRKAL